ncbi:MAG: response regulator transcription factor [Nitrospinae bacterium]|nr:response regulator transcription factor [Nitrospinota bacterium]MCH8933081.1 response regulator transcription factor [Nitrospinota bacterium]MCZ6541480.1 response regulator transcription factor [Nitrospinota bacterium]
MANPSSNIKRRSLLLVDDDPEILTLLRAKLADEPFELLTAVEGESALNIVRTQKPDLVVLDVNLPGLSGLEVCRSLRADKDTRDIPIIILSGRSDQIDRVLGLEFGADDYVTKPFNPRELILRIHNVLRRVYKEKSGPENFTQGDLTVDFLKHEVTVKGQLAQLTLTEFKLLSSLLEGVGQVKTREFLLEQIWEHSEGVFSRTIDTHIQRLRAKLKEAGRYIETVRGVGYRFHE